MGPFEQWARNLRPSWASSLAGQALLGALGYLLGDAPLADGQAVLLEQIPATATDPVSIALALTERQIEAGPSQSFAAQQALADAAPNLNRLRGKALGMLVALYYADFPGAVIVQQNGLGFVLTGAPVLADLEIPLPLPAGWSPPSWFSVVTLGASPRFSPPRPWWTFDENVAFTSRFAVLFPSTSANPTLGTAANLARIQRVIRGWRPSRATCVGVYVCTVGRFVGWPVRNVNDGGNVGPSTVTFYPGA